MRRTSFLSAAGFLLLGLFAVAPRPAHADAVDDIAKIVNLIPGVPLSGADIQASRDAFACIDHPPEGGLGACIDQFNSTPLGQKALGLPSWFHTLILVYADIRDGDFWGLVKDAGYTIACAIANVVFAVDVCGIAQAILETIGAAKEVLSDVVGFIKDVGGAIAEFLGFGGGSGGPPLWQVIFNQHLKPNIGSYAEDWLERPKTFKVAFDVSGLFSQSLVCTIAQKHFSWPCAKLFAPPAQLSTFDANFQGWFRGDTIYAVQMAHAQSVTQAVATVGKRGAEWVQFRHDWLAERAPQDRLRKAYGVWGPAVIKVSCNAAAKPWKEFLEYVNQAEVKPDAAKVLNKLSGWSFQTAAQFCESYEASLNAKKLDGCAVVGSATEKALKLDCNPGASLAACQSADKTAGSTKFPPPFDLQCTTHALKMGDQKPGAVGAKPPNLAPTPVKPVGMPEGPSPK
jgi:hypothetical protein